MEPQHCLASIIQQKLKKVDTVLHNLTVKEIQDSILVSQAIKDTILILQITKEFIPIKKTYLTVKKIVDIIIRIQRKLKIQSLKDIILIQHNLIPQVLMDLIHIQPNHQKMESQIEVLLINLAKIHQI